MPYILKQQGDKFCVFNKTTGENKGCSPDKASATKHMRLLYGIENGSISNKSFTGYMDEFQYDQEQVNYRPLSNTENTACANCQYFDSPDGCYLVQGDVSPTGLCDEWKAQIKVTPQPIPVEVTNWSAGVKGIKEWFSNLFDKPATAEPPVGFRPIRLTKDLDGTTRATIVFSNNFEDRHDQIIPEVVHNSYIEWADRTKLYPEFQIGHLGTKSRWGQADCVTRIGNFTLASGPVDSGKEAIAEALANDPETGVSNGYYALYTEDRKEFLAWYPYEVSALPLVASANVWHGNEHILIQEGFLMKPEHKALLTAKGVDPNMLTEIENDILAQGARVTASGIAAKSDDGAGDTAPAAQVNNDPITATALTTVLTTVLAPFANRLSKLEQGQQSLEAVGKKSKDDLIADEILARVGGLPQGFKATESTDNLATPELIGGEPIDQGFDWLGKDIDAALAAGGLKVGN